MNAERLRIAAGVWLATATALLGWFDIWAVGAIVHPARDTSGNVVFQVQGVSNTVYPFTYVAVALSVLGVAYCVYRIERREMAPWQAAFLGLLVGNLASIGMLDLYEQGYVGWLAFDPGWQWAGRYWLGQYWGSATGAATTLGGILVVLSVLPWSRRQNWKTVALLGALYFVSVLLWFEGGYQAPESGLTTVYVLNAISRGATQLMLVAAVAPVDAVDFVRARVGAMIRPRAAPAAASVSGDE